jgi:hypothetical protein
MLNLTETLGARRDRYATKLGPFTLAGEIVQLGNPEMVWQFLTMNATTIMRIVYVCKDGTVRDIIGRQGVHDSAQDGTVQGTGHAMRNADRMTVSFHTSTFGGKAVNTGAGKGYRTIRAAGIVAIHAEGQSIITDNGARLIASVV